MTENLRDTYAAEGLRYMPKLLSMVDQNPVSKTYGCGDRQYWLYKMTDFPSGMYGEFALPLALCFQKAFPGNTFKGQPRIKELSYAVMRYQAASAHKDGSGDDFYPFERAFGSTAFTLYCMAEAVRQLGSAEDDILDFIVRRSRWLMGANEAGRLSNHHALAALGLAVAHDVTGVKELGDASRRFRDRVLDWQTPEGWFPEYGGFDPGYDTFTISFLAHLRQLTGDDSLTRPLQKAVSLAANLVGPDGSYAGEAGNRNSYHFVPHGFEILAREFGEARYVADQALAAMQGGRRNYLEDNRTFCHYQYNFLQSWLDYSERSACPNWSPPEGAVHYPEGGLFKLKTGSNHAVIAIKKGGVIKVSGPDGPLVSDTGMVLVDSKGAASAPSIAGVEKFEFEETGGNYEIQIETGFDKIPNTMLPSSAKFLVFRILNFTVGRWFPNFLRKTIQNLLINRKLPVPARLLRRIAVGTDTVTISDRIVRTKNNFSVSRILASTDLTTTFTASSNSWHASRLFAWTEYSDEVEAFNKEGSVEVSRTWRRDGR